MASIPYDDDDEPGDGGQSHRNSLVTCKYFMLPHIRYMPVTPDEHLKLLIDFQGSAEMLVRWHHSSNGLRPLDGFLPFDP